MNKKTCKIATITSMVLYVISVLFLPALTITTKQGIDGLFGKTETEMYTLFDIIRSGVLGKMLLFCILYPIFFSLLSALLNGVLDSKGSYLFSLITSCFCTLNSFIMIFAYNYIIDLVIEEFDGENIFSYVSLELYDLSLGFGCYISLLAAIASIVFSAFSIKYCNSASINVPTSTYTNTPINNISRPSAPIQSATSSRNIVCVSGEFINASFPITANESLVIGRDSNSANIVIVADKISRKHCSIRFDSATNKYIVTDFSKNGTFTENGNRLMANMSTPLPIGTVISLGNDDNRFRLQ